jgi:hypothetical protein
MRSFSAANAGGFFSPMFKSQHSHLKSKALIKTQPVIQGKDPEGVQPQ